MSPDAYKNALLITARVTAGLAIAGCGGTTTVSQDPQPQPTTTSTPPVTPPATANPEPEPVQKPIGLACSPPEKTCCDGVFDAIEKDWSNYSKIGYEVIGPCCKEFDPNFQRAACTPWGPPMPPSIPVEALRAQRSARPLQDWELFS